jgi:hypothetical protein
MGVDEEPGRCASVETEARRRRRHGAGCARPVEASRALHADDGSRPALRPRLRKDLPALHGESGSVRRRFCARLVQADPPRHGSDRTLSRPAGSARISALAGPDPVRGSSADRRRGHRRSEGAGPRFRRVRFATRRDGLGIGVDVPWFGQARWRERRAHSTGAAEGLGDQPAGSAGKRAADARDDPRGIQRFTDWRQEGLAG